MAHRWTACSPISSRSTIRPSRRCRRAQLRGGVDAADGGSHRVDGGQRASRGAPGRRGAGPGHGRRLDAGTAVRGRARRARDRDQQLGREARESEGARCARDGIEQPHAAGVVGARARADGGPAVPTSSSTSGARDRCRSRRRASRTGARVSVVGGLTGYDGADCGGRAAAQDGPRAGHLRRLARRLTCGWARSSLSASCARRSTGCMRSQDYEAALKKMESGECRRKDRC